MLKSLVNAVSESFQSFTLLLRGYTIFVSRLFHTCASAYVEYPKANGFLVTLLDLICFKSSSLLGPLNQSSFSRNVNQGQSLLGSTFWKNKRQRKQFLSYPFEIGIRTHDLYDLLPALKQLQQNKKHIHTWVSEYRLVLTLIEPAMVSNSAEVCKLCDIFPLVFPN